MNSRSERDSSDTVSIRNLDQIQEHLPHRGATKLGAMIMASFGGACIVFCSLMLVRSPKPAPGKGADPLGALVAATPSTPKKKAASRPPLNPDDVTFPGVLSDTDQQTTARAAVKDEKERIRDKRERELAGEPAEEQLPRGPGREPPPAADRLPVVPLPAQEVLGQEQARPASPSDTLHSVAKEKSRESEGRQVAESGGPGGYQLQVSSFKTREEAEAFALALRRRTHKAHVEEANVPGRGQWFRVRVGPFRHKRSAQIYREDFEAKERMVTFIVDPPSNNVSIAVTDVE
ncbi:MAG: SPOR domain-containing protein [Deltaproteobacteria bacterium]|nr:SPOR domain-containing protein [Deltaproteobacteria bacterium]